MAKLLFQKTRDVKSPTRGTDKSAGIDFFVPEFSEQYEIDVCDATIGIYGSNDCNYIGVDFKDKKITIQPSYRVCIPMGVKVDFESCGDCMLTGFEKSGVASKKGLNLLAKVIDIDYTGEVFCTMINNSDSEQEIEYGSKLFQGILIPVVFAEVLESNNIHHFDTDRGEGCMGSTGK